MAAHIRMPHLLRIVALLICILRLRCARHLLILRRLHVGGVRGHAILKLTSQRALFASNWRRRATHLLRGRRLRHVHVDGRDALLAGRLLLLHHVIFAARRALHEIRVHRGGGGRLLRLRLLRLRRCLLLLLMRERFFLVVFLFLRLPLSLLGLILRIGGRLKLRTKSDNSHQTENT